MEILALLYFIIFFHFTEGTGSSATPVNNTRNQSYIPTDDVSPRTFVFDVTKPPNTGLAEL